MFAWMQSGESAKSIHVEQLTRSQGSSLLKKSPKALLAWALIASTSVVHAQTATPLPTPTPMQSVPQYSAPSQMVPQPAPAQHYQVQPEYTIPAPATQSPTLAQPVPMNAVPAPQPSMPTLPYSPAPIDATPLDRVPLTDTPDDLSSIEYDARIGDILQSDRKLDLIHHRSQLIRTTKRISRIQVTDPRVVSYIQYTPSELTIIGQEIGTTDMAMWFEDSDDPLLYSVQVVRDPALEDQRRLDYGKIERKIALLYPNSKVYLIPMSRKIIVRGQASDPREAANIMQIVRGEIINQDGDLFGGAGRGAAGLGNFGGGGGFGNNGFGNNGFNNNDLLSSLIVDELEVPGEFQVMVRVRIAELSRSQLRQYGVDWSYLTSNGRHSIAQGFAANAPVLTGIFENGEINVLVDALASNGTAKVMEDSVLTVLSGDSASFLSGGEFAVPTTVGLGGAAAATTTFRGFGVSLIATPTVIDHDLIRMQVVPELSSINSANSVGGVPGVNVNRVQTRVELREGQTIVLGGLFSRQQQTEVTRIPLLGELPLVGKVLFNRKQATEDEKELLIIVTPEIVRAMDPEDVPPMPGFYVTHPDDFDLFHYNRTEGNPDLGHYRLMPIGRAEGYGRDQGYSAAAPPTAQGGIGMPIQGQGLPLPNYNNQLPPMEYGAPMNGPGHHQAYPPVPMTRQQTIQRPGQQSYGVPQQQVIPAGAFRR